MYQIKRKIHLATHPLSGLFYHIPQNVRKTIRQDFESIKSSIHEDMKMSEVYHVIQELQFNEIDISGFEFHYPKISDEFSLDMSQVSVKDVLKVCQDYAHEIIKLFVAEEILEIKNGTKYWQAKDNWQKMPELLPSTPEFQIHVKEIKVYRNRESNLAKYDSWDLFKYFNDIDCVNCQSSGTIGIPSKDNNSNIICPRCSKSQIEKIRSGFGF